MDRSTPMAWWNAFRAYLCGPCASNRHRPPRRSASTRPKCARCETALRPNQRTAGYKTVRKKQRGWRVDTDKKCTKWFQCACICMYTCERERRASVRRWRLACRICLRNHVKSKRVYILSPARYKKRDTKSIPRARARSSRVWWTRRFLHSSGKKCCLFEGIMRVHRPLFFLHTWFSLQSFPTSLMHIKRFFFVFIFDFSKYSIPCCVTENKGVSCDRVYECYLRFENVGKSKFTFFYRTFSAFAVSRKSSTSIVHRVYATVDLFSKIPYRPVFHPVLPFILSLSFYAHIGEKRYG